MRVNNITPCLIGQISDGLKWINNCTITMSLGIYNRAYLLYNNASTNRRMTNAIIIYKRKYSGAFDFYWRTAVMTFLSVETLWFASIWLLWFTRVLTHCIILFILKKKKKDVVNILNRVILKKEIATRPPQTVYCARHWRWRLANVILPVIFVFLFSLQNTWCCSICRRKQHSSSILQPVLTQNSTDSLLDVPIADTLQRRHSDVKIGRNSGSAGTGNGSLGSGLAPPRSPELRRHSDVSPATLKDMEKVKRNEKWSYSYIILWSAWVRTYVYIFSYWNWIFRSNFNFLLVHKP